MKNLKPITRHEQFLQDIADGEVDLKPITRQEYFLAKIAESGGGGGSSLPSYTSSDVGKVLTVGEAKNPPVSTVVVPEQSVTTNAPITLYGQSAYYGVVNNANIGSVSTSDDYTLTVDGSDYETTFTLEQDNSFLATVFDAGVAIRISGDVCQMIAFTNNETHTIELVGVVETKTITAVWASNPLIVKLSSGDSITYTADKTFAELQAANESGIPIMFSLGRWGIGLAPAEWYDIGSAYTAHLLHIRISNDKKYLEHGIATYSESGITVAWDYKIEMTAV